ncbi:helix-turn-helix transcriptional regulator [Thorsellia kenyensis]|uniref:Helix-turn-helix transcriptional regulator n=1 Tax=Thorsellia kenyensis TaxID=1549888 RepID=A0ABV6C874_9GAMM
MRTYEELNAVPPTTRDRLAYIDFILLFKGEVNRVEICRRFNVYPTQVTKDFVTYKKLAPNNIFYDSKLRMQIRSPSFTPLFEYDINKILASLGDGFGDGMDNTIDSLFDIEIPYRLSLPSLEIISSLTNAIYQKRTVEIFYHSLSSGSAKRKIAPHSIVNNGMRWHVRAYDEKSKEFRDFVLTRIQTIRQLDIIPTDSKKFAVHDEFWNKIIEVVLIPHPKLTHKKAIEHDYGMVNSEKKINIRAANIDYLMRLWNVDCTTKAIIEHPACVLHLKNSEEIQKLLGKSFSLAPNGKNDIP